MSSEDERSFGGSSWFDSVDHPGVLGTRRDAVSVRSGGGSVAAFFGLAFGFLALATPAWGRWRKTAVTGIAVSSLALLVGAAEVVVFVFFG